MESSYSMDSTLSEEEKSFLEYICSILRQFTNKQLTIKVVCFNREDAADTTHLYEITYDDTSLILKAGNGNNQNILKVKTFIENKFSALQSFLILPIVIDVYKSANKNISYQLMLKAPGQPISKLFDQYLTNQISADYLNKCYFQLGQTIANLHQKGNTDSGITNLSQMQTQLLHNDLHDHNIFYDGKLIYLIDNDGINKTIDNPSSVEEGLKTLLLQTTYLPSLFIKDVPLTSLQREEIREFSTAFFKGYVSQLYNLEYSEYLSSILQNTIDTIYQSASDQPELSFLNHDDRLVVTSDIIGESISLGEYNEEA
jgi:hypothetical protein